MKIIDLLNKIANGEEVPKKIWFDNTYWNRKCDEKNVYYSDEYYNNFFVYIFRNDLTFTLNDEVEILEEEKKIPEKLDIGKMLQTKKWKRDKKTWETINEIIDCLDYLKSKGE